MSGAVWDGDARIQGRRIVWTRNAGETGALFVHDLASGTTSQLTAEVAGSVARALDGPYLVYG